MYEKRNESTETNRPAAAWLSALMLRDPGRWSSRLGALVSWMKSIGRGQRRRLGRAAAGTLAGASGIALMALLAGPMAPSVHAATITVGASGCTSLIDAIKAAEGNPTYTVNGCTGSPGADTIELAKNITLDSRYAALPVLYSYIGLPEIRSQITIQSTPGNNFTIARDASADKFRLFTVASTGNLTLKNVTLSNGYAIYFNAEEDENYGSGGAVFAGGPLTLDGVTLSENESYFPGGAIMAAETTITVTNSVFTGNVSVDATAGAMRLYGTTATIADTVFRNNEASSSGGAIRATDESQVTISNSVLDGNVSLGGRGGAINLADAVMVMTDTLVINNRASASAGAIYAGGEFASVSISGSTISGNESVSGAGAIRLERTAGDAIYNSTISFNSGEYGGGIDIYNTDLLLAFTTIISNHASADGGGLGTFNANAVIVGSIISGNSADRVGDETRRGGSGAIGAAYSVLGHAGVDQNGFYDGNSFLSEPTNFDATSDGNNVALSAILDTTLADNGGPALPGGYKMLTHNLVEGSPAIDLIPTAVCEGGTINVDQRGISRPQGEGCDAGAVEFGGDAGPAVLVSTWAAGSVDGLSYGPADILQWDGDSWTKWFAGTDAGLEPTGKWKHNLNAIWISDTEITEFMVSFVQNQQRIGDLGWVDGYDILMWDGDAFSRWFEGERVGLNVKTQEKIDGLHVMSAAPEWSEFADEDCEAYLLLSTQGAGIVPKPGNIKPKNVLKFGGEDVLGFCATNLGPNTTGFWEMVLDGSADGVGKNNIDSLSMNEDGSVLYLTSKKAFAVDGALGGHSEVFAFDMAAEKRGELRKVSDGDFSGPLFSIYDAGMSVNAKVDALHVAGELESED